ncbi:unnamed protein product, partial [Closterium sp. Naga37s-1]
MGSGARTCRNPLRHSPVHIAHQNVLADYQQAKHRRLPVLPLRVHAAQLLRLDGLCAPVRHSQPLSTA